MVWGFGFSGRALDSAIYCFSGFVLISRSICLSRVTCFVEESANSQRRILRDCLEQLSETHGNV